MPIAVCGTPFFIHVVVIGMLVVQGDRGFDVNVECLQCDRDILERARVAYKAMAEKLKRMPQTCFCCESKILVRRLCVGDAEARKKARAAKSAGKGHSGKGHSGKSGGGKGGSHKSNKGHGKGFASRDWERNHGKHASHDNWERSHNSGGYKLKSSW